MSPLPPGMKPVIIRVGSATPVHENPSVPPEAVDVKVTIVVVPPEGIVWG